MWDDDPYVLLCKPCLIPLLFPFLCLVLISSACAAEEDAADAAEDAAADARAGAVIPELLCYTCGHLFKRQTGAKSHIAQT